MSAAKGSRMLRRLYDWTLRQAAHRHAEPVLATVSFTESSVFPIPADVLFIPMCLARPDRAMRYAALATVASVLGGVAGWLIGRFAFALIARPLLEFYGKLDAFQALAASGPGLVLLLLVTSGFSHLPPMKVVTILAGLIGFPLVPFVASAIVARGGAVLSAGMAAEALWPADPGLHRTALSLDRGRGHTSGGGCLPSCQRGPFMNRNSLVLLAMLGSAALLGGAFFFQFGVGLLPCQLCLWQRWPHGGRCWRGCWRWSRGGGCGPGWGRWPR
jgi:membrane protein YqaA with SNARE-associated domain